MLERLGETKNNKNFVGKEFGFSKLSTETAWVTYLVRLGWKGVIFLVQFDLSALFSAGMKFSRF